MFATDDRFLRQLLQVLLSSLRQHQRQSLIGMLMLVLTRFANLSKASPMPVEKQHERHA